VSLSYRCHCHTLANTNKIRPVLFHPPLFSFMIGQSGLFVWNANLDILLAIRPIAHADILASSLAGLLRAPDHAAVHARQDCQTPKLTMNSLFSSDCTRYARRPNMQVAKTAGRLLITRERTALTSSRMGEIVDKIATSYPDMPMCHSGKYHTTTPRDVRTVQKTNCGQSILHHSAPPFFELTPMYTSDAASAISCQTNRELNT
jgi:hypothetical protein